MALRRINFAAVALAAVVAAVATFAVDRASRSEDAAGIGSIRDSYAFDVKDKTQLMAYADEVFVGDVREAVKVDEDRSSALWRVGIVRSVKGGRSGEALVWQLGYIDGEGRAHVPEEQALLAAGRRALLVTTRDGEENTLVAGPAAHVLVSSQSHQGRIVEQYRAARR